MTISLTDGSEAADVTSTIGGVALVIKEGSKIEVAIGGDGDDALYGSPAGNRLAGGRGDDFLEGQRRCGSATWWGRH